MTSTAASREIEIGAANLARHIGIVNGYGLQAVVGVNKFPTDTEDELELVRRLATESGAYAAEINTAFENGGHGGDGARRGGRRRGGRAEHVRLRLPARRPHRGEDPPDRHARLRRRRRRAAPGREDEGRRVGGLRARAPPDLHGEDAPLALARSGAEERADRLHGHGSRPPALHGRRLDRRAVRRHDDHARPRQDARRRSPSTSTSRARPSVCSKLARGPPFSPTER